MKRTMITICLIPIIAFGALSERDQKIFNQIEQHKIAERESKPAADDAKNVSLHSRATVLTGLPHRPKHKQQATITLPSCPDEPVTGVPFDKDPRYTRCTNVNFTPVYFGFDSSNLRPSEMTKIETVAAHIMKTGRVVIIEGHCDEREGSNEYSLALGEIRAIAIRDYLVALGIKVESIQTKSYGEERPVLMGHDESAWRKNRRSEFAVFARK